MKRKFALLLIFSITALAANAAGMVYDPAEYTSKTAKGAAVKTDEFKNSADSSVSAANKSIETKTKEAAVYAQNTVSGQSANFNNALFELDNAQVNIRNQLLEYQSKYQELDTQYKLIKEQRRVLSKQTRQIARKIKAIEKSKNQIRKTMK